MPLPPRASNFNCPACGWKKTVVPSSAASSPTEGFSQCPECPNERLQVTPASAAEVWRIKLARLLGLRG
ncbi:hypothetical protein [Pseudomonas sp. NA-150]|uniref:hypothetical protein n=1 Tax=Pseudomonas sp. NA-150 TaxID=3367525 RepID=UPI0037C55414